MIERPMKVSCVLLKNPNRPETLLTFMVHNEKPPQVQSATKKDSEISYYITFAQVYDQYETFDASQLWQLSCLAHNERKRSVRAPKTTSHLEP